MAKRRRKKSYGKRTRKNAKRVRAGKRAYKKSGLYKYNLRRKKSKGKRRGKYTKRKRHTKRRRAHGRRRRHHRVGKAQAYAARLARRLAKSKRTRRVKPVQLSSHQNKYLAKLRAKAEAAREHIPHWAAT